MGTTGSPIMGSSIVGSSAIIGPDGRILSAPKTANEQLVVADLDLSLVTKTKTFADASGHCKLRPRLGLYYLCADFSIRQPAGYAVAWSG